MRIGLIDIDGHNFPNLALMKLSAWHKAAGDCVEWYNAISERYDLVYCAKVFSFTPDCAEAINADRVVYGGSGYFIHLQDGKEVWRTPDDGREYMTELPREVEHTCPDYALYGIENTAYGFLTRGCPRGCAFCHVAAKEGCRSVKVADLSEFWRGEREIILSDPNILACPDWRDLLRQLRESGAYVDFNQGLDARLLTEEKAEALHALKFNKTQHFAWDRYADKERVLPRLRMFAQGAKKTKGRVADVFVLTNFDTTLEQDLERVYTLRDLGYYPYVMVYDKQHAPQVYRDLQRWCNNRIIFAAEKDFKNYNRNFK